MGDPVPVRVAGPRTVVRYCPSTRIPLPSHAAAAACLATSGPPAFRHPPRPALSVSRTRQGPLPVPHDTPRHDLVPATPVCPASAASPTRRVAHRASAPRSVNAVIARPRRFANRARRPNGRRPPRPRRLRRQSPPRTSLSPGVAGLVSPHSTATATGAMLRRARRPSSRHRVCARPPLRLSGAPTLAVALGAVFGILVIYRRRQGCDSLVRCASHEPGSPSARWYGHERIGELESGGRWRR